MRGTEDKLDLGSTGWLFRKGTGWIVVGVERGGVVGGQGGNGYGN